MKTTEKNDGQADIWAELQVLKVSVLAEMGSSGDDNAKLRNLTDWLRRELDLEARYKGFVAEAQRMLVEQRGPSAEISAAEASSASAARSEDSEEGHSRSGGKAEASEFRNGYLAREKSRGRHLTPLGGIYFRNDEGVVLGVTFSSEKGKRGGETSWFLNLLRGKFQDAVLLCQTSTDCAKVVHLPRAFLDRVWQRLSRDGKGEVKFNLAKREGKFWLQVPGPTGWMDVDEYVDGDVAVSRQPRYV